MIRFIQFFMDFKKYIREFYTQAKNKGMDDPYIDKCLSYAEKLKTQNIPIIYDGIHLSKLLGYKSDFVFRCSSASKKFYRIFSIPKKSGGQREIMEPLPELKEIQKWIAGNILENVTSASACVSYQKNLSVKSGAKFHRKKKKVLKLDIKNFFPSTGKDRVINFFCNLGYTRKVSGILAGLTTVEKKGLPQGAPTSPLLSNLVNREIDLRILGFCRANNISYSRYADDLSFSGDFSVGQVIAFVKEVLFDYGYSLNEEKTRLMQRGTRQIVNGIVVNDKLQVPNEIRRLLRQKAHYIKKFGYIDCAIMMRQDADSLGANENNLSYLIGLTSYALSINPSDKNLKKYLSIFKEAL